MNLKKFAPLTVATMMSLVAMGTVACGDDSSSGTSPVVPENPNGQVTPENPSGNGAEITNPDDNGQGGLPAETPIDTPVQPGDNTGDTPVVTPGQQDQAGCAAGQASAPVAFEQSKFNDIGEVYKNIQCDEKVVFIVRHAEREGFTGSVSALTEDGFEAAVNAGKKLIGEGQFKYIYSGMTRTMQTALGIAAGRGDATFTITYAEGEDGNEHFTVVSPEFTADTIPALKDGWFLKDKDARDAYMAADSIKNVNVMYAAWAYDGKYAEAFYDLEERSQELISTYLIKDYAEMPKYTVVASHDQVLMPLTVWATGRQIDLKLHNTEAPRNWLNYLAGVAIIINDKNEVRYAPIKGMNDSVMPDGTVIDGGIQ
ncbi:MAG: hypothetical protein MJZ26_06200 [Fibrobacter sp.]|nr:hypothetical protein [Fibrobacter sp.]